MRHCLYIGSPELRIFVCPGVEGFSLGSPKDLRRWAAQFAPEDLAGPFTFRSVWTVCSGWHPPQ